MSSCPPEVTAARLAAKQFHCISLAQAVGCGMSDDAVYRLVKRGLWRRRLPRVYVVTAGGSWRQDLMAGSLWLGKTGAISGHAAAALWSMPGFPEGAREFTTTGAHQSAHGLIVHRVKELGPHEVARVGPLVVTSPARTIVDLSACCDPETYEVAFHSSLARGLISIHRLEAFVSKRHGRRAPGAPLLRKLLAVYRDDQAPAESPLEVFALKALARAKLPPPRRQFRVEIDGARYRIDLAYPEAKLAIEVDGYRWHSSRLSWERDRIKAQALERTGWKVLRGTYASIREEPDLLVDEVAAALGARLRIGEEGAAHGAGGPSGIG